MHVFVGWDPAESAAADVATASLARRANVPLTIDLVRLDDMRESGMYTRPTVEPQLGQLWDVISNAPMSTEFAISRFFVPHLANADDDWALFVDSDIVALHDPLTIMHEADERFAIQCVQHPPMAQGGPVKKVNKPQTAYPRKNWSSVMLWNLRHPALQRLSLEYLNEAPGRDLHRFVWLEDDELGALSPRWNWLVSVQDRPEAAAIAHFTLGGPWLAGWAPKAHDDIWLEARDAR